MPSRLARDIQRRCIGCRATVTVRPDRLYHVVVRNPRGGTMRDGGFDCPRCGAQNAIPGSHLPQGLLPQLPGRDKILARFAPAPAAATAPAAPTWSTGPEAGRQIREALAAARADLANSHVVALVPGITEPQNIGMSVLFVVEGDVLAHLDQRGCELLVVSHLRDGVRVKLIAHPTAGVASLVPDPA